MPRSLPFGFAFASRLRPRRPSGRRFPALAVAVAVLLAIFSHRGLAQQALTGDQILALIAGNTLQGSFMTNPLTMVFYPDGVVRGAIGLTGSDSGDWEIEGDNYCNEWVTYFSGVRRCYRWIPRGDGYLLENVDTFKVRNIQGRIVEGMPKGY
jgi:hypothetical protein